MATAALKADADGLHLVGEPEDLDVARELLKAVAHRRDTTGMVADRDEEGDFRVTITTTEGIFEYVALDEDETHFACRRVT
jgi:hypothetical protein